MSAKAIMVLGTTSGAGKSWLTTALCRWYARQGLKVAPFKAQNMSNNARVVPGLKGQPGEIGSAQYFQALAAGVAPDVRMNPVLLKPEHDTGSQVIVLGEVRNDLRDVPWRQRSEALWPFARQGLDALMAEHDLVVIEGAGSPAEINLHSSDYVNMRTALHAQAACLLVTDIDRGGAFAHLYGTHQLLPPAERALIQGFVLNRFRGDASLLAPGPEQLQALTGVPTVGVLPMWRGHGLPEEDGVFDDAPTGGGIGGAGQALSRVAVIAYPRLSNLDEFQPLRSAPGVRLVWARHPRDLDGADWLILPGSKHTRADLAWLRSQGLDDAILRHAQQGRAVLGVCGGLQMLGTWLCDPDGIEGAPEARVPGLGLLPLQTTFDAHKLLRDTAATFAPLGTEAGPWQPLGGVAARGYEIHHGRTEPLSAPRLPSSSQPTSEEPRLRAILHDAQGQALGWQQGRVLGCYLHGLFEDPAVMQALFGAQAPSLPRVMDGLADFIDQHMQPGALWRLLGR
ncbi:cobyric acid synthase [Aquabacterium sp.]|uniref:cobyric acid synthase n=1 Tax=Aquabacterium sp. TaxID=1872578 RepID=UPI0025C411A4|nr:cobyric acid synthase [Aquabacterium sp.]